MTALPEEPHRRAESVETPSGKWRSGENFPVGSFLIRRDLRPHVHAFYRFARNADDIADNPALTADEKIARLDRMAAILDGASGDDSPAASAMRESLLETGTTAQHCHDVLHAFRLDAVKLRYRDWDDLMGYCRYSASPVGRQLLDLHGESRDHLAGFRCPLLGAAGAQSPAGLRRRLPAARPRLPAARRSRCRRDRGRGAGGRRVEPGTAPRARPAARPHRRLIDQARGLPPLVASRGLRWESAVIVELAGRLLRRLRRGDPVATRVALRKSDFLAAFAIGVSRGFRG